MKNNRFYINSDDFAKTLQDVSEDLSKKLMKRNKQNVFGSFYNYRIIAAEFVSRHQRSKKNKKTQNINQNASQRPTKKYSIVHKAFILYVPLMNRPEAIEGNIFFLLIKT
jgi:hypothetical protein